MLYQLPQISALGGHHYLEMAILVREKFLKRLVHDNI